jgi:hypothetical protein
MRTATVRWLAASIAAAIGSVSRSETAGTADSTQPSGGDVLCAFAMSDAKANEEAPYFTKCRLDSFWSVANGLPQVRDLGTIPALLYPCGDFEKNRAGVFCPSGVVITNGSLKSRSTRTMDGET